MTGTSAGDQSRVFRREWFEKTIYVQFEGHKYPAPVGADAFLRRLYGDYMKLPPKSEQVTHHKFKAWYKQTKKEK